MRQLRFPEEKRGELELYSRYDMRLTWLTMLRRQQVSDDGIRPMRPALSVGEIAYPAIMLGIGIFVAANGNAGRASIATQYEHQRDNAPMHKTYITEDVRRNGDNVQDAYDISLKGVFYSGGEKYASISVDEAAEMHYREGDKLVADVVLAEILVKSINVIANGVELNIPLEDARSTGTAITLSEDGRREREEAFVLKQLLRYEDRQSQDFKDKLLRYINGRPLSEVPYPLGTSSQGVTVNSENSYSVDMESIKQQLSSSDALQHARLDFTDDGVRLEDIVPGSIYDKAGLISGDRIVSIQGHQVSGAFDLLRRYHGLSAQQSIDVVVERDGERRELKYYTY